MSGRTQSADFPVTPALAIYNSAPYLVPHSSGDESFVVRIDPSQPGAASLDYRTFLGRGKPKAGGNFATGIAVDGNGATYVAGETMVTGTPYVLTPPPLEAPEYLPFTADAFSTSLHGVADCMLMRISPDGGTLDYATFFGGADSDRTYGLAVDAYGNLHWTGLTF